MVEKSTSSDFSLRQIRSVESESKISHFNKLIAHNEQKRLTNPFSENWQQIRTGQPNQINKDDPMYGVPTSEKTFMRGLSAQAHVNNEVRELCEIIKSNGYKYAESATIFAIDFKTLFVIYTAISNKLVGLLLRARKHGYVDFEGEILFQGRDDHKIIKLLNENYT